jgi:hypothetical protein
MQPDAAASLVWLCLKSTIKSLIISRSISLIKSLSRMTFFGLALDIDLIFPAPRILVVQIDAWGLDPG